MLTIEEQIERIADEAFERASTPVPSPRRWPALAAAAVVLLVAGSLTWVVVARRASDDVRGSADQDRLTALLAAAEEYPLSSADPPEGPSGLSFREPGTVRAVTTPDGATVFRESGVTAVPGYGAFETRCVGFEGRTSSCELPSTSGLPWIPDPARIRVAIWADVPAEVDVVVMTDGDRLLWQHPVDELAVWPPPVDPGWTLEAFDTSGRSIARIDRTTLDERDASSSPNDDTDDAASSATALSSFRSCLVDQGATFDRDVTLPQFPVGTDVAATWDRCVELALPARSKQASSPTAEAGRQLLPSRLPDEWGLVAVSRTSSIVQPFTDQVFGRYEQDVLVGLRVTVTSNQFLGVGQGAEEIEVRGKPAGILRDDEGWHAQWGEAGVLIDVTSKGLDREALLAAVEQLELRSEPIEGFEPTSAPAGLTLVSEAVVDRSTPQVMTGFRLTQGGMLPSPSTAIGGTPPDETATIFISDRSGLFGSAPRIVFDGQRRGDLVIAPDPAGGNGVSAVFADGTIVEIRLPSGVNPEVAEAILGGLSSEPISALVGLMDRTSERLGELPLVRVAAIDEQRTLRLRGGTSDAPIAMCLDVDGTERCTLAMVASPIGDPSWVNGVLIDDRWYLFGFEPAEQGWLTIAPWEEGDTLDPLPATSSIVDGVHYWFTEIPTDVDDVRVLDLPSAQGQATTFRRPDR